MKTETLYLLILILLTIGCEKEHELEYDVDVIFYNIKAYPNDSISLTFNILFQQKDSDLTVEWISPDTLKNKENGILSSSLDIPIEFNVLDNNKQIIKTVTKTILIDTILANTEYDFRNMYEGDFDFFIHQVCGDINYGNYLDTNYIVNGFILKQGGLSNSLLEINYGTDTILIANENGVEKVLKENSELVLSLDNSLSYPGGIGGYGHTWVYGEFINTDSLELHVSVGGLGFWITRDIVALKINNR